MYDFTHTWNIKQNIWWLLERKWGEDKMGKGGQINSDGWKLDFWAEHTIVYTDIEL